MSSKKAFDFKRGNAYTVDPDEVVIAGLDDKSGPGHALYDPDIEKPIAPEVIANYDRFGIIVPIQLAKYDGLAYVVAGRTRVRGAREVNKLRKKEGREPLRIQAVMTGGSDILLTEKRIAENAARKTIDVIAKATDAQFLIDQGRTAEEVAVTFAVSTATVKNWLGIQGATADVKRAVMQGKITASAAAKIARLEGADAQREALDETIAKGPRASTKAATRAVAAKTGAAASIGLGRRDQRKLLDYAIGGELEREHKEDYWLGFADAMRVVLGDKPSDDRARDAAESVR